MTKHINKFLVAILVTFFMFGCASQQNKDPLEGLNRTVYKFNDVVDKVALKPVAQGYQAITPTPVQTGVKAPQLRQGAGARVPVQRLRNANNRTARL